MPVVVRPEGDADLMDSSTHQEHATRARARQMQELIRLGVFETRWPYDAIRTHWSDELYRIVDCSPARGPLGLLGSLRMVDPCDRPLLVSHLRQASRTGESFELECKLHFAEERYVRIVVQPTELVAGQRSWLGAVEDITERRRLEWELQQTHKLEAIGSLTTGIAHDYNNLLMGLSGCVELALRHVPPESKARRYLAEARKAAQEGGALTRQLMAFARPGDGEVGRVDVDTLLSGWSHMLHTAVGEGIDLRMALRAGGWQVRMARDQVEQVVMNLVLNARDAMRGGGALQISTRRSSLANGRVQQSGLCPGDYVCIEISDTGTGMDRDTLRRSFEPFFSTKDDGVRSSGLGLSIAYGLVTKRGGRISGSSRPGKGTSFLIHLPRAKTTRETLKVVEPSSTTPVDKRYLLVVEDDALVRMTVRAYLEEAGYAVLEACDSSEASLVLQRAGHDIRLVLTDVMLPGGSGAQVAAAVSGAEREVPVVFMSAYPTELLEASGRIPPGSVVLNKPFEPPQLLRRVQMALRE
jgi:signal transduction histidine kinase/CheY-like chemotaxis protein